MTDRVDSTPHSRLRVPGPLSALGIGLVLLVLLLDQGAKAAALAWLPAGEIVDLLPILQLTLTFNIGIAFSLFTNIGSAGLTIATLAITVVVIVFWTRSYDGGKLAAAGFALIVGGALGNLIDRIVRGHVIDFLHLHIGDRTLFVFNLADAALTLGPIALIAAYLFERRPST